MRRIKLASLSFNVSISRFKSSYFLSSGDTTAGPAGSGLFSPKIAFLIGFLKTYNAPAIAITIPPIIR